MRLRRRRRGNGVAYRRRTSRSWRTGSRSDHPAPRIARRTASGLQSNKSHKQAKLCGHRRSFERNHARVSAYTLRSFPFVCPRGARRKSSSACMKTAKARARAGVSARARGIRNVSDGSGVKSTLASGNSVGPPERACERCSNAIKPGTKAPAYHVRAQDGSTPVETEPESTPPPAAATALELAPSVDTPALVLNDPAALQARLDTYSEAREVLVKWILSKLVAGIDYTLIHRKIGPRGNKSECPNAGNMVARVCEACGGKSTLCKPGSEKICGLLQLRPRFRRDVETWEMLGSEPGVLALICELVTASGVVVAEGRGARHRDMDYGDLNKSVKMTQKSAQTDAVLRLA